MAFRTAEAKNPEPGIFLLHLSRTALVSELKRGVQRI